MTLTVDKVYPPVQPDPAQGIKGRISYKVIMTDGNSYYAGDEVGPKLNIGHSYDNLDINEGKYGNKWLNWRKGSFTPTQEPKSIPPAGPTATTVTKQETPVQGRPNMTRDRSIILQCILKACAKPDGSEEQADNWLRWYAKRMRTGVPGPEGKESGALSGEPPF